MIYEFTIKEIKKTVVPVRAESSKKAQEIFDKWYGKHADDPKDTTIYDLLDDGYEGREFNRSLGIPEKDYPMDGFMLPEESNTPIEPVYDLVIRYGDSIPVIQHHLTIFDISQKLSKIGETYYMYPDTMTRVTRSSVDKKRSVIYIYAVPKNNSAEDDEEETWYECVRYCDDPPFMRKEEE